VNAQKANNTIGKVRQLQRKLYQSAKLNSKRKFHALYDKVYRRDILEESWKRVRASGGKGWWVVDADIKGYFNNINHEKLMLMVKQRISDRRILKTVWKWLKAGIMEDGEYIESELGSPQGGVISPLLGNIYLHYLDLKWELHFKHLGKLIRYCDDFVIICRTRKEAEHALKAVKSIMQRLELELHPDKTKLVSMWDGKEGFDFLGFHHRRKVSETSKGQLFNETHQFPSRKAMQKMRDNIKSVFANRATLLLGVQDMIEILNPKIIEMRNYYGLKHAGKQLPKICTNKLTQFG
jgi:RNA-directed DNA polymerase